MCCVACGADKACCGEDTAAVLSCQTGLLQSRTSKFIQQSTVLQSGTGHGAACG